jgi:hypothetical protein
MELADLGRKYHPSRYSHLGAQTAPRLSKGGTERIDVLDELELPLGRTGQPAAIGPQQPDGVLTREQGDLAIGQDAGA